MMSLSWGHCQHVAQVLRLMDQADRPVLAMACTHRREPVRCETSP